MENIIICTGEMMVREITLPAETKARNGQLHHSPLSLCPHAAALGSTIYGFSTRVKLRRQEEEEDQTNSSWLSSASWKTCLATKQTHVDDDDDDDDRKAEQEEADQEDVSSPPRQQQQQQQQQHAHHMIISQVVSNADGSIIAVSSSFQQPVGTEEDGSTTVSILLLVTLLRGSDGQVLVTRQVESISQMSETAETSDIAAAARLSFVGDASSSNARRGAFSSSQHACMDALLIQVPGSAGGGDDSHQLIVVSGIHGQALNSEEPALVQQATRSMKVRTIQLPTATATATRVPTSSCAENGDSDTNESHHQSPSCISSITGFFLPKSINFEAENDKEESRMIRLVACDTVGSLSVYDHNPSAKTCNLVQSDIVLQLDGHSWKVDCNVGLIPQKSPLGMDMYLVCAAVSGSRLAVAWLDPMSLKSVCHYPIETSPPPYSNLDGPNIRSSGSRLPMNRSADKSSSSRSQQCLKVFSIQPVKSCMDDSALAVAIAVRGAAAAASAETQADTTIHVLQAVVEDTMGLTILSKPHSVFKIPGHTSHEQTLSASLSSPCIGNDAAAAAAHYSFLFQQHSISEGSTCIAFDPPTRTSQLVGRVTLLLEEGNFEKANEMLHAAGVNSSMSIPCATFHPSDVILKQLMHESSDGHGDIQGQVQAYLGQLVAGAKSGSEEQLNILLKSVNVIMNSSLGEAVTAANNAKILSVFKSAIKSVIAVLPQSSKMVVALEQKNEMIDERLSVLKFLGSKDGQSVGALTTPLSQIQTPAHLLTALVKERKFTQAAFIWRSSGLQSHILPEVLVSALLQISADVPPAEYLGLLHDVAMPSLTINHELLPPLRAWCCRIADAMDEKNDDKRNLNAAISLLETVHVQTKELQLRVHSSFSTFTPFVENTDMLRKTRRSPRSGDSETSRADFNLESSRRRRENTPSTRPVPSMLQLVGLKSRAAKTTTRVPLAADSDNANEETEECVEEKLQEALCLKEARQHGMARDAVTLKTFSKKGGAHFCAKELVRYFSTTAETDHDLRTRYLAETVEPFCATFAVNYGETLLEYAGDICKGMRGTERAMMEAASVARCCRSVVVKCRTTLAVLRAALLRGYSPPWLMEMSVEAIAWASCDTVLQSELEEAARLLLIDGIISKYCGNGARELFRVDNPRHAARLVQFVSRQIDNHSVLDNVISLCGAFTHLSSSEACCSIFQQAIISGNPDKCAMLFRNLYDRDPCLARKTLVNAIFFIAELLGEDCDSTSRMSFHRERAVSACASACELLSTAKEYDRNLDSEASTSLDSYLDDLSLDGLHQKLLRLHELQSNHGVFLTLGDFSSPVQLLEAANRVFKPVVDSYAAGDMVRFHTDVEKAKRACSLLVGCSTDEFKNIWAVAAMTAAKSLLEQRLDNNLNKFLHGVDMLDGKENETVSRARLTVAFDLCNDASEDAEAMRTSEGIRRISIAASLLRNHGVLMATNSLLPATIALDAHLDTACQILVRADEGHGDVLSGNREKMQADAWKRTTSSLAPTKPPVVLHVSQPALHPSWYIGDGLLLPPSQALSLTSWFCREMIREHATLEGGTNELYRLLADRGAHSLALRVLAVSTVGFLSVSSTSTTSKRLNANISKEFAIELVNTGKALAERSLGGSVAGMTSGVIDSQLAVAFLLALPLKSAYKVYKSALPTAMKTRSFERIFILANIGKVTCSGCPEAGTSSIRPPLWKRQEKFLHQCERLSTRAAWWHVLRHHGVEFDPNRFLDPDAVLDESIGTGHGLLSYVETLIYPFVASLMETLDNAEVLHLATLFATSFGLKGEVALQKHIEFLLSPPQSKMHDRDVRLDLTQCRRTAKESLRGLPHIQRCAVLRRCLMTLFYSKDSSTDYERFSLVLSLYYEALVILAEKNESLSSVDRVHLESEMEQIGRRRDAILILSSYFQGIRSPDRPNFIEFFRPIEPSFGSDATSVEVLPMCGVLGSNIQQDSANVFDPLRPLENIIATSVDMTSTTALAPLWLSLGLPNGYIHARFLIARFESAAKDTTTLPSFENDVIPVLDRLRSSHDKAILAEWCGHHYTNSDEDKLKCLDVSLHSAMILSAELEQRRQHNPNLAEAELQSLDTVKRITAAKEAIEDRLKVKHVLRSSALKTYGSAATLIQNLIEILDERVAGGEDLSPEDMVDFLLSTGSQLAATSCLDDATTLSTNQLRQMSSAVHAACNALSERHSHIHPDQYAKRLAHKWLFFGVDATADHYHQPVDEIMQEQKIPSASSLEEFNEDDTINFVMDLDRAVQGGGDTWNDEGGFVESQPLDDRRTSEEEPSALKAAAAREVSESKSHIAAIRIAFVLAYTGIYGVSTKPDGDENTCPQGNDKRSTAGKKRVGLLTQIGSKRESRPDASMLLAQELLRVVFAKAGDTASFGLFGSNGQRKPSTERIKSVTFAMRHRALRAAAILCPQEAVERVIQDEASLRNCSLKLCSFGSFVAKEIEEMGLPLPHSDLRQLSTMHYSSYARALWRHHSDGDMKGSKGRLLLLLLEMCLKEDQPDARFVEMIFNEMERLELCRTLLLAAERVASFKKRVGVESSALSAVDLCAALEIVSKTVFSELKNAISSGDVGEELAKDAVRTVRRLADVYIDRFHRDVQSELDRLIQLLQSTMSETKHVVLQTGFQRVLTDTVRWLSEYAPTTLVATA